MHLMIQPIVLMQLLNNEVLMGQGLLARCLFSAPAPIAGMRKYQEIDLNKDPGILAFYDHINKVLDRPYPRKNGDASGVPFGPEDSLVPTQASLEKSTKKRWIEFHDETDRKMSEDGEFYPIKSFASKAPEQVLRIAALFAFFESSLELDAEITIGPQHLERAIVLVGYYLGEALRILGKSSCDPIIYLATQTLEWIKRNRPDQTFPTSDIYQRGPTQIRNGKIAKKILKILEEHEHVIEVKDAVIGGRKVRSAWRLNGMGNK